jgi:hypothetical protein
VGLTLFFCIYFGSVNNDKAFPTISSDGKSQEFGSVLLPPQNLRLGLLSITPDLSFSSNGIEHLAVSEFSRETKSVTNFQI